MTLIFVVLQTSFMTYNIYKGIIWFVFPTLMIISNDIFAYLFGFFLGKTPLIKLSPKKTWEGFIGGALATFVLAIVLSDVFCKFPYLVC